MGFASCKPADTLVCPFITYYFARGSGCEVSLVRLSVFLSVCVSVRQDISRTARAIFTIFFCVLPVSVARSSSGMFTIGRIAYRREGIFFPIDNAL